MWTTRFAHDAAGRLVEQHDPTGARHRWSYDPSGRPQTFTAGSAEATMVIGVERDALARPVRITETATAACAHSDGANAASGAVDAPDAAFGHPRARPEPIELRWDAAGRLVERRAGSRAVG